MATRALVAALQAPPEASATYTLSCVEEDPSVAQAEKRKAPMASREGVFME
jgi:hypothetical protein